MQIIRWDPGEECTESTPDSYPRSTSSRDCLHQGKRNWESFPPTTWGNKIVKEHYAPGNELKVVVSIFSCMILTFSMLNFGLNGSFWFYRVWNSLSQTRKQQRQQRSVSSGKRVSLCTELKNSLTQKLMIWVYVGPPHIQQRPALHHLCYIIIE